MRVPVVVAVALLCGAAAGCARGEPITVADLPVPDVPWCQSIVTPSGTDAWPRLGRRVERRLALGPVRYTADSLQAVDMAHATASRVETATHVELDARGRLVERLEAADGRAERWNWLYIDDDRIREIEHWSTDTRGVRHERRLWDEAGRLVHVESADEVDSGWTRYEYDRDGRLSRAIEASRNGERETVYTWDFRTRKLAGIRTDEYRSGRWRGRTVGHLDDDGRAVTWTRYEHGDGRPERTWETARDDAELLPDVGPAPLPTLTTSERDVSDHEPVHRFATGASLRAVRDPNDRIVEVFDIAEPALLVRYVWSEDGTLIAEQLVSPSHGDALPAFVLRAVSYRCEEALEIERARWHPALSYGTPRPPARTDFPGPPWLSDIESAP